MKAPAMPTMMFPARPKPQPLTRTPASQPAIAPMTSQISKPVAVMLPTFFVATDQTPFGNCGSHRRHQFFWNLPALALFFRYMKRSDV